MNDQNEAQTKSPRFRKRKRGPKPQRPGVDKPSVYRVVIVTRFGRNYHEEFQNPDHAFMMFVEKVKVINILYVAIFKDGNLLQDDIKEYVTQEEPALAPEPEPERADRASLEALREHHQK